GRLDAGVDERLADPAAGGLRPHRERADLGEIRRERGEGAAPDEAVALRYEIVAQVVQEELTRARQHEVLRRVLVDELAHRVDVVGAGRTDAESHARRAERASPIAARTRSGAVPPGDDRDAREREISVSATAVSPNRGSAARSSPSVIPTRPLLTAIASRTRPT